MKSLLFLIIVCSAAALPSAVVLPASELTSREIAWHNANPSGLVRVLTGNSMRPMLQPNDRLFFEAYVGQKLKGSVVLISVPYNKLAISHFVYDETPTHVYTTGINNRRSDGWQAKFDKDGNPLVRGVLVGVLRTQ